MSVIDSAARWFFGDLVLSKDGSVSQTKLAASTAHFNAAWMFVYLTIKNGYNSDLWAWYLGITVIHAGVDKGMKVVQSIKEKNHVTDTSKGSD